MNAAILLRQPTIRLFGDIDDELYSCFTRNLSRALEREKVPVLELSTLGGDADIARRIAVEIRLLREERGLTPLFIGKAFVYSAGVTIMSAFRREHRYLTRETRLLVHERRLDKEVKFSGPLSANLQRARELVAEMENGIDIEDGGFQTLVEGTEISLDEIRTRARANWYLSAQEALQYRLIADVV